VLPTQAGCWPKAVVVDVEVDVAGGLAVLLCCCCRCARFFCLVLFFVSFLHLLQAGFWLMVAGCCPDCSHLGGHPGFVSCAQVSPASVNEISLALPQLPGLIA